MLRIEYKEVKKGKDLIEYGEKLTIAVLCGLVISEEVNDRLVKTCRFDSTEECVEMYNRKLREVKELAELGEVIVIEEETSMKWWYEYQGL